MRKLIALVLCAALLAGCAAGGKSGTSSGDFTSGLPGVTSEKEPNVMPIQTQLRYRAMWFSYLEWQNLNTSSLATFKEGVQAVVQSAKSIGVNCIILQVRPFSDAIYPSEYFPWSHIISGTQGRNPGYDPLQIFIETAHAAEIAVEAWINPYRVRLNNNLPNALTENNPAVTHPEWTIEANGGLYFNPASAEVQQYIIDGVLEILQNYEVDGIQFDDYFYPTTDASFDETDYAAYDGDLSLFDWRRENVNTLVRNVYTAIKTDYPHVQFGISPQGNNDQNYNSQYSDVALWLREPGYVDYVMPQVYWGYGYTLKNGSQQFGYENIVQYWAELERHTDVALAFGLGAYRIGGGDGGANDQTEWSSGRNLAKMISTLHQMGGIDGYALYRYDNLFHNTEYAALAEAETTSLRSVLGLS